MIENEFKEIAPFIFDKTSIWKYEHCGGFGEDNDMTDYKIDILYTRLKFKHIALQKGLKPRFKFKRIDLHWVHKNYELINLNYNYYQLLGKLILIDSENKEFESDELTWLYIENPKMWEKANSLQWFSSLKRYNHCKEMNERRWNYLEKLRSKGKI